MVGTFAAGGAVWESELWCDAAVLQPAYRRGNSFQTVLAKLESPAAFDRFKDALTTDPRLDLQVLRETDYYANQGRTLNGIIRGLGFTISVLMAIGAVFGALNTMYSAVAARTREIATLRALGFGASPVVVSVLAESLLLALVGGAIGALGAYLGVDGFRTSTLNWDTFSQVTFAFDGHAAAGRVGRPVRDPDGPDRRPLPGLARRAPAGHGGAARGLSRTRMPVFLSGGSR